MKGHNPSVGRLPGNLCKDDSGSVARHLLILYPRVKERCSRSKCKNQTSGEKQVPKSRRVTDGCRQSTTDVTCHPKHSTGRGLREQLTDAAKQLTNHGHKLPCTTFRLSDRSAFIGVGFNSTVSGCSSPTPGNSDVLVLDSMFNNVETNYDCYVENPLISHE